MSATRRKPYFRQLGILSDDTALILGLLEMGLNGDACKKVGVHTSPRGVTLLLDGRKICSGRTVREFVATFKELQAKAAASKE